MDHIASDAQIPEHPISLDELLGLQPGDDERFNWLAQRVFQAQRASSLAYGAFAEGTEWVAWEQAPFLPVEAFKWSGITAFEDSAAEIVFLSSATGGAQSRHPVRSLAWYEAVSSEGFQRSVGVGPFRIVANLPTYEALGGQSSLIHMVETLMQRFGTASSCFVSDADSLRDAIRTDRPFLGSNSDREQEALIVFGTAFGLLDAVDEGPIPLPRESIVIETGGMKTRRREMLRGELHQRLADGFAVRRDAIRSEYGMCEMLSQCYTSGGQRFDAPPWLRFKIVDPDNPLREAGEGEPGLLAFFDLANCHSVSAILTSDLGVRASGGFEVLGRVEGAELRGCNFLFGQDL